MPRFSKDNPCLQWMSDEELLQCRARLEEIKEELCAMGANEDYCRQYFQSDGGFCELVVCGQCKKHRMKVAPLPDGLMCSEEFGQLVAYMRSQVAEIKSVRNRQNQVLERLLKEDTPSDPEEKLVKLKAATDLKNEVNHLFMQLQGLMGGRMELLEKEPVDAPAWHRRVKELLNEKIELLERLKLGPSVVFHSRLAAVCCDEPPARPPVSEPCPLSDS